MKLTIESAKLSIDIDPEDLSDEDLMQCCAVAASRGLSADAGMRLRVAVENAHKALMRGHITVAVAVLQDAMPAHVAHAIVNRACAPRQPNFEERAA